MLIKRDGQEDPSGTWTYTISDVPEGDYTVKEKSNGANDKYTCVSTPELNEGKTAKVTETETDLSKVSFANEYTEKNIKGDLRIQKKVTVNGSEPAGYYKNDADGTYHFKLFYDEELTQPVTGYEDIPITISNGEIGEAVVTDLDEGTYYVSEITTDLADNISLVTPSNNKAEVVVVAGKKLQDANACTFTNNATVAPKTGYLKFTKTLTGIDDANLYEYIKFEITGPNNYKQSFTYADIAADGGVKVLNDVLLGEEYKVTEIDSVIPPQSTETESTIYTRTASAYENSVTVTSQNAAEPTEFGLTNEYTKTTVVSYPVVISKKAVGGVDELDGATLSLKSEDGTVDYGSWTSSATDGPKQFYVPAGTYVLTEIRAPKYYDKAEKITFMVSDTGVVTVNGEEVTDKTITMFDQEKVYDLELSKKDLDSGEDVVGATMVLTGATLSEPITWITDDNGNKSVSLKKGTYTLEETSAPNGYEAITSFTFDVDEDDAGNLVITLTDSQATVNGNVVTVFDKAEEGPKKYKYEISKRDATNVDKEIDGATLQLIKLDGDTETVIRTWESSTTKTYTFDIEAGGNYRIKEIKAPKNYQPANFELEFTVDNNGKVTITKSSDKGNVDSKDNIIMFYNDPIEVEVTGWLSVYVEEELTGRPVPEAVVEVTDEDGNVYTITTRTDGQIDVDKILLNGKKITVNTDDQLTDENGKFYIRVPAGKYTTKVVKVPEGYDVTVGETGDVTVPENDKGRHEAKIIPKTGGLRVQVLEEGTLREVPGATVEIEAPEGKTFPDGSTKITVTTDEHGWVTSYKDKDGNVIDLTSGLEVGNYKITITKVPEGYKVTTGKTETVEVKKGQIATHQALIATTYTSTNTPATTTTAAKSVDTGDHTNVIPFIIMMIVSLISSIVVIIRKRRLRYEY